MENLSSRNQLTLRGQLQLYHPAAHRTQNGAATRLEVPPYAGGRRLGLRYRS